MVIPGAPRRRRKDDLSDTGRLVTERRLALGLTQVEVADLAGVGLSSVRALEAGSDAMTLTVVTAVLDALGLALAIGPRPALHAVPGVALLGPAAGSR